MHFGDVSLETWFRKKKLRRLKLPQQQKTRGYHKTHKTCMVTARTHFDDVLLENWLSFEEEDNEDPTKNPWLLLEA